MLSKRYRTDKSQLRYLQLTRRYGQFYVDFLKTGVKSVRQFIGGTLYTNRSGFKKFSRASVNLPIKLLTSDVALLKPS